MIVCKFGGSSSAKKSGVKNILRIVKNINRKIIVFSAIGKSGKKDSKITDLLIALYYGKSTISQIESKFKKLAQNLGIKYKIGNEIKKWERIKSYDALLSRGEYLTAKMFSKATKIKFVDATKLLISKSKNFNSKKIESKIAKALKRHGQIIVPGFYFKNNNKIQLFSRGGGDVSGAYLAKYSTASTYEIWTDVPGVYSNFTNSCKRRIIRTLSYEKMLKMSSTGAKVVHPRVCNLLKQTNIITKIKSTFEPNKDGTEICN